MINVEMHGRLGNQLFQYATARSLQEKTHQSLLFSFRTVNAESDKEGNEGWEDSLKKFKVKRYETYTGDKSVLFLNTSFMQKFWGLLYYMRYKPVLIKNEFDFQKLFSTQIKWQKILNKNGIWWMKQGYYEYSPISKQKTYVLNGGFESKKYFDSIKDKLCAEIVPIQEPDDEIKNRIGFLENNNSVCVSVRHFSLTNKEREEIYNVCSLDYYRNAIEFIKQRISNPIFYICSNDQEWVKDNFSFGNSQVIYEDASNDVSMKLFIMTKCKHFIISNSTFSWWAQYLNNEDGKIVISPKKWYNSDFESELIEDDWIKI